VHKPLYVIKVIPAHRSLSALTYFSAQSFAAGEITPIEVSGREIAAMVVSSSQVANSKWSLKKQNFRLKKLEARSTGILIPEVVVAALRKLSEYYLLEMALILELVMPRLNKIRPILNSQSHITCAPNERAARLLPKDRQLAVTVRQLILLQGQVRKIRVVGGEDSYRDPSYPNLDLRVYIKALAEAIGAEYVEGESGPIGGRRAEIILIKMSGPELISPELRELITSSAKRNKSLLLVVARKGYATTTVCRDCGSILYCPNCSTPLVLFARREREYVCNYCTSKFAADQRCSTCGGWKLEPHGIATQRVETEVERIVQGSLGDKIRTSTLASAQNTVERYDNSAVMSVDSIFATPDFNIRSKVFNALSDLASNTGGKLLIQTRHHDNSLFRFLLDNDKLGFEREDNKLRKTYNYPPFATLIKITHRGNQAEKSRFEKFAKTLLHGYNPTIAPAFIPVVRNKLVTNVILRLPLEVWPNERLERILRRLKEVAEVHINPRDLL